MTSFAPSLTIPKCCAALGSRVEQIQINIPFLKHPIRNLPIVFAPVSINIRVPHCPNVSNNRDIVALRSIERAGLQTVNTLDDIVQTSINIRRKPSRAASSVVLEQVHAFELIVLFHPLGVVRAIDAVVGVKIGIERVVIANWHIYQIVVIILVSSPEVIQLHRVFEGAVTLIGEEPVATLAADSKEVRLLVPVDPHVRGVVPPEAAVIDGEIRKVVVLRGVWGGNPGFVLGLRVRGRRVCGAVRAQLWKPLLTTILERAGEVFLSESVLRHPILVVASIDAVQLANKIGEPALVVTGLGAPDIYRDGL
mmetsp:Transcript_30237/g.63176  ORF Transcript_30237/g.63176 Transcript_30237/m.63176 type:complete len:309 (+) Transcript_30237:20-946(+)